MGSADLSKPSHSPTFKTQKLSANQQTTSDLYTPRCFCRGNKHSLFLFPPRPFLFYPSTPTPFSSLSSTAMISCCPARSYIRHRILKTKSAISFQKRVLSRRNKVSPLPVMKTAAVDHHLRVTASPVQLPTWPRHKSTTNFSQFLFSSFWP